MIFWNVLSALVVGFGWGVLLLKASASVGEVSNGSIYFMIAASCVAFIALAVMNSHLSWKEDL